MNWNQLEYVLTIAQEKSITKAAEKLYLSQPSLSISLKNLETELETPLFERQKGELVLTYAGQLFCDWAEATLASHYSLTRKLSDIAAQRRRLIRLGISPHRSLVFMPPILKQFYSSYPECELQIVEKPTFELKALLEEDHLDFIIDLPHPDTINFENHLLAEERVILAVPNAMVDRLPPELRNRENLHLPALADFPFILLSSKHVIGQFSRRMCHSAVFSPTLCLSCDTAETALLLTSNGMGISFVPELFAAEHRFENCVRYYGVQDFQQARQICLIHRRGLYLHQPLRLLIELFQRIVPDIFKGNI